MAASPSRRLSVSTGSPSVPSARSGHDALFPGKQLQQCIVARQVGRILPPWRRAPPNLTAPAHAGTLLDGRIQACSREEEGSCHCTDLSGVERGGGAY